MSFNKQYTQIIVSYLVWLLYITFFNDKTVMVLLGVFTFGLTIYIFMQISDMLTKEREQSVFTLQTRLKKSERANEEAYKKFLNLSTTLGSGVFMVDEQGIISFSNKDVENYFGINMNSRDYHELVIIKQLYYFIDQAYMLEEYYRKQIEYEEKTFDLISTPLLEGDVFAGCLVLVHDITQLKVTEKYQKQFTADVSHELRTPLSAIKGYSEILQRTENIDEKDRNEFIDTINKEANKMEVILNDLMVISRLDRIDYELDLKLLDISETINENYRSLIPKFNEKKLKSSINVEPCVMLFDKVKISQVILNIVKNAINYTDEGYVNIVGEIQENNYVITINDSGIGIPEEKQDKIFTRFYRVDKARSRETGGSGLGLSISKNVILKHDGKIEVESVENKGSTFIISLPIKK